GANQFVFANGNMNINGNGFGFLANGTQTVGGNVSVVAVGGDMNINNAFIMTEGRNADPNVLASGGNVLVMAPNGAVTLCCNNGNANPTDGFLGTLWNQP